MSDQLLRIEVVPQLHINLDISGILLPSYNIIYIVSFNILIFRYHGFDERDVKLGSFDSDAQEYFVNIPNVEEKSWLGSSKRSIDSIGTEFTKNVI